jgi:hypothetical protein
VYSWDEASTAGRVTVGKYCCLAHNCVVSLGGGHRSDLLSMFPWARLENEGLLFSSETVGYDAKEDIQPCGRLVIGNDVWICLNTTFIVGRKDIHIGDGATIGANSTVSESVGPYEFFAGNRINALAGIHRIDPRDVPRMIRLAWWDWPVEKINKMKPVIRSNKVGELILASEAYDHENRIRERGQSDAGVFPCGCES